MSNQTKTFAGAFSYLFRKYCAEEIYTAMPGEITKYDILSQKSDVKPLIKRLYDDGTETDYPVIPDVPVMMPRTSDSMIKLPVKKGDKVLLVFSKMDLDNWLLSGGISSEKTTAKFQIVDAIAILGLYPFNMKAPVSNNNDLEIVYKNSKIKIEESGKVDINNGNLTVEL